LGAGLGKKIPAAVTKLVDIFHSVVDAVRPFVDSSTKLKLVAIAVAGVIMGPLISSIVSLGIAIMTTPVGWILAAFAAIAFAIYEIYKHWDGIKAFFAKLWDGVKAVFVKVAEFLGNIFLDYTPIGLLMKHWGGVKDFFTSLWDGVTAVFQKAWDFILSIVDKVTWAVDKVIAAKDFLTGGPGLDDMVNMMNGTTKPNDVGTARRAASWDRCEPAPRRPRS
jgi:phage-related protein